MKSIGRHYTRTIAVLERQPKRRLLIAYLTTMLVIALTLPAFKGVLAEDDWETHWPTGQPSNQNLALAVAPTDGHTIYVSTLDAVYRTTDDGANWSVMSNLANVVALAVDPGNRDVVYAYCWPNHNGAPADPKGLRKSSDGGRTWTDPTGGASASAIGPGVAIAIDTDRQTIVIGTAYGPSYGRILRSTDAGATWQLTYTVNSLMGVGGITALIAHPTVHNVMYAANDIYHGGEVIRSDDGGATWRALAGAPYALAAPTALAVNPVDPNILYAAYQAPMSAGVQMYRSDDGGSSWMKTSNGLPATGNWGPQLAINSLDPSMVFLSLRGDHPGVYRTTDAGATWQLYSALGSALDQVNALRYSTIGRRLYAATDSGPWQRLASPSVAPLFLEYYNAHDGFRVMGRAIGGLGADYGLPSQYYEKGRLEDHSLLINDTNWRFMYGLLVDELQNNQSSLPVGGDVSTLNYGSLHSLSDASKRVPAPPSFTNGISVNPDGSVFIPYNAQLDAAGGHNVPGMFWAYINRADLFPAGWLHDIGLPMTEPVLATVDKGNVKGRQIWVQAFQRTILTYDPANPADWQVERANVGSDYYKALK